MAARSFIFAELEKEISKHEGGKPFCLKRKKDGLHFEVRISGYDQFSVVFEGISIKDERRAGQTTTELLEKHAKQLEAKLAHLLHELKVMEIDSKSGRIQLRSKKASRHPEGFSYYEVVVSSSCETDLIRYRFNTDSNKREQVPFSLTKDDTRTLLRTLAEIFRPPAN